MLKLKTFQKSLQKTRDLLLIETKFWLNTIELEMYRKLQITSTVIKIQNIKQIIFC